MPFNNSLFNKKINLRFRSSRRILSFAEVDTAPLIEEKLQSKVILIKKFLNKQNYKYDNFKILKNSIKFNLEEENIKSFENDFVSKKDNTINPYIDQYRSYELDLKKNKNEIEINFSKYGILTLNNSAVKQSIEIVRRRIDDLGTKEPTIIQRGEKRIVVELPGLKDPSRIKNLLGKTANLNFRLVTISDNDFGFDNLISETGEELKVSKKIIFKWG